MNNVCRIGTGLVVEIEVRSDVVPCRPRLPPVHRQNGTHMMVIYTVFYILDKSGCLLGITRAINFPAKTSALRSSKWADYPRPLRSSTFCLIIQRVHSFTTLTTPLQLQSHIHINIAALPSKLGLLTEAFFFFFYRWGTSPKGHYFSFAELLSTLFINFSWKIVLLLKKNVWLMRKLEVKIFRWNIEDTRKLRDFFFLGNLIFFGNFSRSPIFLT